MNDWLYVAKRQGKTEFVKAFARFDPRRVEWTTNVDEAAEFTEAEWERIRGATNFILAGRLCLVSYADEPRKRGERPTGWHGKTLEPRQPTTRNGVASFATSAARRLKDRASLGSAAIGG